MYMCEHIDSMEGHLSLKTCIFVEMGRDIYRAKMYLQFLGIFVNH